MDKNNKIVIIFPKGMLYWPYKPLRLKKNGRVDKYLQKHFTTDWIHKCESSTGRCLSFLSQKMIKLRLKQYLSQNPLILRNLYHVNNENFNTVFKYWQNLTRNLTEQNLMIRLVRACCYFGGNTQQGSCIKSIYIVF